MSRSLSKLLVGIAVLSFILVVSVLGYVAAGWSLLDAIYMVIITIFSVGFGEVRPIDSPGLVIFTSIVIVLGCSTVIYIMGVFFQLLMAGQISEALGERNMNKKINALKDHVIICGFGRVGRQLVSELADARVPFVVIDRTIERLDELESDGHFFIAGDATEEKVLIEAGIEHASTLASVLPDDAANVFITLSARNLNSSLRIVARGDYPSTKEKLLQAGADKAVLPTHIGAERLAGLILRPDATAFFEADAQSGHLASDLAELGIEVEEIKIPSDSHLVGSTLAELETRGRSAFLIVSIQRKDGTSIHSPPLETNLVAEDTLIVMCHAGSATDFAQRFHLKREISYRGAVSR